MSGCRGNRVKVAGEFYCAVTRGRNRDGQGYEKKKKIHFPKALYSIYLIIFVLFFSTRVPNSHTETEKANKLINNR